MTKQKHKQPSFNQQIAEAKKEPRAGVDPDEYLSQKPLWCFKHVQLNGAFAWCSMHDLKTRSEVYGALRNYGSMFWKEIESKKSCHGWTLEDLSPEGQEAITGVVPDPDTIYQLRVSGPGRIYGLRRGHVLSIILWDEKHLVYPQEKP